MGSKIFKQVFWVSLACFLVCCCVLWTAVCWYADSQYVAQLRRETLFTAAAFEQNENLVLPGQESDASFRVTHIGADGSVLYDSVSGPVATADYRQREEVREALDSGIGESRRHSETQRRTLLYCAVRLQDGTVVRLSTPPYAGFSLLVDWFYWLLASVLLALVMALLLAFFVSKNSLRPIQELNLAGLDERDVYPELQPLVRRINTQSRQINRQMEELKAEHARQDALRREFTANVSHELKTPLTSIAGFAELMRDGLVKPEDMSRFGGKIYDESQRLIVLVGDIIKLSQLESDIQPPEKTMVDLRELCGTVLAHLDAPAQKKGVTLSLTGESVSVLGAESVLYEMVYNLCDNAIKYNRPNGTVTVDLAVTADGVCLAVSDTGIGIPEEDIDRVFERFYRVDKSHSKEVGGTGLGLAIVKHGALFHQATMETRSRVGEGTTITIHFPAQSAWI